MAKAYSALPDVEPAHFDPRVWEASATANARSENGDEELPAYSMYANL